MADERTRYSDAELEEFKQLILKKLENARADYELLRATITHTADNDTEDTSPTFKVLEEGAATLSKEESGRLAAHQMKFIRNLEMAHGQAHSQGAPDESAPRHRVYRGQGGTQVEPEGRADGLRRGVTAPVRFRKAEKSQTMPGDNIRRECILRKRRPSRPSFPVSGKRFFIRFAEKLRYL